MDAYHAAKLSGGGNPRPGLFSCAQSMCAAGSSSSGGLQGGGEGVEFQRGLARLRELLHLVGRMRAGGILCSSLYELTVPELLQHVMLEAGVALQPGLDTEVQEQVSAKSSGVSGGRWTEATQGFFQYSSLLYALLCSAACLTCICMIVWCPLSAPACVPESLLCHMPGCSLGVLAPRCAG